MPYPYPLFYENIDAFTEVRIFFQYIFDFYFRFLQAGSYPVSTPDGGRLPADMKVFGQLPNNLTFHPENGEHSMVVTSPDPGNWFLLAYINKKEKTDYVQEVKLLRLSFPRNFLTKGYSSIQLSLC